MKDREQATRTVQNELWTHQGGLAPWRTAERVVAAYENLPDIVTDEMVERAFNAGLYDLGPFNRVWDKPAMRAALEAALNPK